MGKITDEHKGQEKVIKDDDTETIVDVEIDEQEK